MSKILKSASVAALALLASACSQKPAGWTLQGTLDVADSIPVVLQASNGGYWYSIDTIHTDGGKFKYTSAEAAPYPDVMRLAYQDSYVYFPIDSTETVTVNADGDGAYTLGGSLSATAISSLDSLIRAQSSHVDVVNDEDFKRQLFTRAFSAPSVLPAYYLLNRSVGKNKLFDPSRKSDLRMYGAVAQRFTTDRPDDLRGKLISRLFLQGKAMTMGIQPTREMTATETGVIEISRSDNKGTTHSLRDLTSQGKVVLLSFTNYTSEASPAYNVLLGDLYSQYHDNGLEIYQIAFDGDETLWMQTAENLPWITVWNSTTDDFQPITSYNVGVLPTTFIIDRQGTIRQRIVDPTELPSAVKKYI